ncbi:uncharacterized protein EI90DRAFT_1094224 [Cantharellus anzutake]|uniref:uncharacterized protein n=1 Tax=Cantharellus anzutake TaxID=1750568 RepID=UPI001904BFE3|nr:uncharacterized protein EI90DRAFT_1094224 [Cantharellus anzutake]KAF8330771.1 hypothetical protein EI90DRAFT_1094224 [Cantharellus anzutake]
MTSSRKKIAIYVSNHRGYVWTPEEVSRLRSEARVAGILIGTLPSIAQQNVFLGLPLLLLPEEVAFLVDKGIAELHDDSTMSNSHDCPTSIQLRPDQSAQPQISIESAVAAAAGMGVAKECSGSSILTESRMVSSVRGDESKEEGEKEETTKKMLEEDAAPVMDREEGDDGSSTLPQPHSLLPQPKPPTELAMSIKAELELGSNGNNDNDNNILTEQEGDDAVNKVEEDGEKEIDRKKPIFRVLKQKMEPGRGI